jgi:hypothetical protein
MHVARALAHVPLRPRHAGLVALLCSRSDQRSGACSARMGVLPPWQRAQRSRIGSQWHCCVGASLHDYVGDAAQCRSGSLTVTARLPCGPCRTFLSQRTPEHSVWEGLHKKLASTLTSTGNLPRIVDALSSTTQPGSKPLMCLVLHSRSQHILLAARMLDSLSAIAPVACVPHVWFGLFATLQH